MTAADVYIELGSLIAMQHLPAPETVDLFQFEGSVDVRLSFPDGETHHVDVWADWFGVDIDPPRKPYRTGNGKHAKLWRYYEFHGGTLGGHPVRVECSVGLGLASAVAA